MLALELLGVHINGSVLLQFAAGLLVFTLWVKLRKRQCPKGEEMYVHQVCQIKAFQLK
jgi:hypothetical protein